MDLKRSMCRQERDSCDTIIMLIIFYSLPKSDGFREITVLLLLFLVQLKQKVIKLAGSEPASLVNWNEFVTPRSFLHIIGIK